MRTRYETTELEIASFLKARGHPMLKAEVRDNIVTFAFDPGASADVEAYFGGVQMSARELFEAHRSLRALIQQVKKHNINKSERRITYANRNSTTSDNHSS